MWDVMPGDFLPQQSPEQIARRVAMKAATENASDLKRSLQRVSMKCSGEMARAARSSGRSSSQPMSWRWVLWQSMQARLARACPLTSTIVEIRSSGMPKSSTSSPAASFSSTWRSASTLAGWSSSASYAADTIEDRTRNPIALASATTLGWIEAAVRPVTSLLALVPGVAYDITCVKHERDDPTASTINAVLFISAILSLPVRMSRTPAVHPPSRSERPSRRLVLGRTVRAQDDATKIHFPPQLSLGKISNKFLPPSHLSTRMGTGLGRSL